MGRPNYAYIKRIKHTVYETILTWLAHSCEVYAKKRQHLPVKEVLRAGSKLLSTAGREAGGEEGNNHAVVPQNLRRHRSSPAT